MKKFVQKFFLSMFCGLFILLAWSGSALAFEVEAAAAILIDANTGRVLYEQNAHESLAPASTTKILTALITLEEVEDLSQTVVLPDDFVNVGESGIYLEPGEEHSFEDLLYALMLRSANDAGQALGIGVAGSEEAFVELMNQRTQEMGLQDSHWANPHGLDADDHYTSAHDLAMITREALRIPKFNELITANEWTMPWLSNTDDRSLYNHNQFLDIYEGGDGVKTGYTSKAGNCLVASATRDGLRLIGVVLNCNEQGEHYQEMCSLMDYGFTSYDTVTMGQAGDLVGSVRVQNGNVRRVNAVLAEDARILLEKGQSADSVTYKYEFSQSVEAPIQAGTQVGVARYTDAKGTVTEIPICVKEGAESYTFGLVWRRVWQAFFSALLGSPTAE